MMPGSSSRDTIVAAGGVLLRPSPTGPEVLLIHRHRYGDWCLPKGKSDPGESPLETALREVREETGYDVEAVDYAGDVRYPVNGKPKIVHYWTMKAAGEQGPIDVSEVAETAWLSAPDALARLTYDTERRILETALARGGAHE